MGGPGSGRRRKLDSKHHQQLRKKVRRFRERHKVQIKERSEAKRLLVGKRAGGDPYPPVFLYELVDESGQPKDVVITQSPEPPTGCIRSRWLPSTPVGQPLARMLRENRIKQIAELRDGA
jgi:hypothetical protein